MKKDELILHPWRWRGKKMLVMKLVMLMVLLPVFACQLRIVFSVAAELRCLAFRLESRGMPPHRYLLLSGVTPLRGHYTSSELVQCSLTGAGLPGMARLESHWSSYGAGRVANGLVAT